MQTIVVLTDFSAAAENATAYAAAIAKEISGTVLLFNTYELPLVTTEFPVLLATPNELKKGVDEQLLKAKRKAEEQFSGVPFTTESRLATLTEAASEVATQNNAFCLVAGSKQLTGFDAFVNGDTLQELRTKSSIPMLLVPADAHPKSPKNIVLAVDNQPINSSAVQSIKSWVQRVNAQLHLVHIKTNQEETEEAADVYQELFAPLPVTYESLFNQNIADSIQEYLAKTSADLLIVMPRKHNFWERLFTRSHSTELACKTAVPVLCLPAGD